MQADSVDRSGSAIIPELGKHQHLPHPHSSQLPRVCLSLSVNRVKFPAANSLVYK